MNLEKALKHPIFETIARAAAELDVPAYVIGGFVRDFLMNRLSHDIDIVVVGNGIELARKVSELLGKNTRVNYFKNFGTAMLRYQGKEEWIIEFVGARKESYRYDSRKPIVENGTLEDDQNRRDFTINALAISLQKNNYGQLIDPFDGMRDLEEKILRTPLDPDVTYSDDPLRMMRAIRFATQLEFEIEPGSFEAIKRNRDRIKIVSQERVTDELNKIIEADKPSKGFYLLDDTGMLNIIFPQMAELKGAEYVDGKGHKDNFKHTLEVLDNIAENTSNLWLRWAAILHDIAKPTTKNFDPENGWTFHSHDFIGSKMVPRIFKQLRLPLNEKMHYVKKLVLLHLRPIVLADEKVTDSAIRRLLFDAGDEIDDLMTLCKSDVTSKNPVKVKRYLKNFKIVEKKLKEIEEKDRLRNWQPPISGDIIMETFNIRPCREVGMIKNAIREAILDGEIRNDYDEAYQYMLREGVKLGLKQVEK
jgi:poly(A) polymerase